MSVEGIFGRDDELVAVTRFLNDVPTGPTGLLVAGEPGVGKTTLWKAGVLAARQRSHHVLSAAPAESEASLSFSALGDLLEGIADGVLSGLPGLQRRALEVALLRADDDAAPPDPRTVSVAVLGVIRLLADSAPVIVAIDDAQWVDPPSVRVLHFAVRRLATLPVGLLCSLRVAPEFVDPFELARALPEGRAGRLTLGPLSTQAIHEVIHTHLGLRLSRPVVARIHDASGGNPFYALQFARALGATAGPLPPGEPLTIPRDLRAVLRSRLAHLPRHAREALLAASVLSHPTHELLRAMLQGEAEVALARAQEAGVIECDEGGIHCTHPLLASTAYLEAPPEARLRLHRRAAALVVDPEERARHLAAIATAPDPTVAAALDAAAHAALGRGAPDTAAELREQAARFTPADRADEARTRALAAAEHHLAAGDLQRAQTVLEAWLDRTPPGPARAEILRLLGERSFYADSFREAASLLQRALAEAETDIRLRAATELDLGFVLTQIGDLQSASAHASSALQHAEDLGEPRLLAQALAGTTVLEVLLGLPLDADKLERARALEDSLGHAQLLVSPTLMGALIDLWRGRLEEARNTFAGLYQVVVERGEENSIPVVLGLWGGAVQAECWAGDLERASRYADASLTAAHQLGGAVARGLALSAQSWVQAYRGEAEATRKAAEESAALLEGAGVSALCLWPLGMMGFLELSRGDPAAALETLGEIGELVPAVGVGEPAATPFVPDAIEALVGVGELDRAGELLGWLQERAAALNRPWTRATAARCQGLLLAAKGDLDGARSALERALAEHECLPMPLERARTLLAKGTLHRRRKEKRAAKEVLQTALETFERLGARLWADKAREEVRRIGLRPSAPRELTATEEKVAELAAAGATTNEIAHQLFMSPKTVESVITRIYRKIGVRSRAELATLLPQRRSQGVGHGGV